MGNPTPDESGRSRTGLRKRVVIQLFPDRRGRPVSEEQNGVLRKGEQFFANGGQMEGVERRGIGTSDGAGKESVADKTENAPGIGHAIAESSGGMTGRGQAVHSQGPNRKRLSVEKDGKQALRATSTSDRPCPIRAFLIMSQNSSSNATESILYLNIIKVFSGRDTTLSADRPRI